MSEVIWEISFSQKRNICPLGKTFGFIKKKIGKKIQRASYYLCIIFKNLWNTWFTNSQWYVTCGELNLYIFDLINFLLYKQFTFIYFKKENKLVTTNTSINYAHDYYERNDEQIDTITAILLQFIERLILAV